MEFMIECPRCGEVNDSRTINEFSSPYFADDILKLPASLLEVNDFEWAGCEYVCPDCKEYFSVPEGTIRRFIDERMAILIQKYQIIDSDLDMKFMGILREHTLHDLGV